MVVKFADASNQKVFCGNEDASKCKNMIIDMKSTPNHTLCVAGTVFHPQNGHRLGVRLFRLINN